MLFTKTCTSAKNFGSWVKKQTKHHPQKRTVLFITKLKKVLQCWNYFNPKEAWKMKSHLTVEKTIKQTGRWIKF